MKINGIVLAAGYGSRLKPLTEHLPKPLLPVCGKPIIELALQRMEEAGAKRIAVNTHHLPEMLEAFIENSRFKGLATVFREPEILGTGGPLVNAKKLLSDCDCFILHNGDIVSGFDLRGMVEAHMRAGATATMAVIDGPENKLLVSGGGKVLDILGKLGGKDPGAKLMTYAGIAVLSPEIFKWLPEAPEPCSIIDAVLKSIAAKEGSVRAFAQDGRLWSDIGSFEQYFKVHEELLPGKGEPFHFGPGSSVSPEASLSGFVSASEGCSIGAGATVSNCVLLPGASVPPGDFRRNEAIGQDFSVHREQPRLSKLGILASLKPGWAATSLAEQGSDRRFYRIREPGAASKMLLLSSEKDQDFQRYIDMGAFMHAHKLRTPEIFASDGAEYAILMEDLGDSTLFKLMERQLPETEVEKLYGGVVDALAEFQARGVAAIKAKGFQIRLFDYEYLRWETSYFKDNFLELLCGVKLDGSQSAELDSELHALAEAAFAMPHTLIHRDFQSQNILICDGTPRFVDFQGARLGPYAYDLASLLKDPYVKVPKAARERLAARHHARISAECPGLKDIDLERHLACLSLASLQRNMQALGAYGFLSLKKRKGKYLAYAAPCLAFLLESLEDARLRKPDLQLRRLQALCMRAQEVLTSRLDAARDSLGLH